MAQKKQTSAVMQAIYQFDIHTQVRKIALETIDAYMIGNKQAFAYISEWEHKFIQFQARLMKAQTYYKNIQINVNNKMEITNQINARIDKFNQQFWKGMKQYEEYLQGMRKNYHNLVKQTGNQAANIRTHQRQLSAINAKIQQIQNFNSQQSLRITEKINQNQQISSIKNNKLISDTENLILQFTKSKAELDSKIQLLTQLCNDIGLYKNQKSLLSSQLSNIYEQLNNRVLLSDFGTMRIYIDNVQNGNNQKFLQIQQKFAMEADSRLQDKEEVSKQSEANKKQLKQQLSEMKKQISMKDSQTKQQLKNLDKKIAQNTLKTLQNHTQNVTKITELYQTTKTIQQTLQQVQSDMAEKGISIQNIQTQIKQIHLMINQIQQSKKHHQSQFQKFKQESRQLVAENHKIKLQSKEAAQIQKHIQQNEKKHAINNQIAEINQKIQNLTNQMSNMNNKVNQTDKSIINIRNLSGEVSQKIKITQNHIKQLENKNKQFQQNLSNKIAQFEEKLQNQLKGILNKAQTLIVQNISKFQSKFDFLQQVSRNLQIFKGKFDQQLQMNEKLNKQIKQKMDRIFGMFTKLKSDTFIKMQAITNEQTKLFNKQKQILQTNTDQNSLLGIIYEFICVILCVQMCRQLKVNNNTSSVISQNQNQLSSTIDRNANTINYQKVDKQQNEQYKIASLIQGWVLQFSDNGLKYRGQAITKKALIKLSLQQYIKNGDKFKSKDKDKVGLIENGKQIFMKMMDGSQFQQLRKRAVSRGRNNSRSNSQNKNRQSELPKVYR